MISEQELDSLIQMEYLDDITEWLWDHLDDVIDAIKCQIALEKTKEWAALQEIESDLQIMFDDDNI